MLDYQKLQNHRQQTEREIDEAIEKYNAFVINRPCGYGKTYQIIQQCKKRQGMKVIIEPTVALKNYVEKRSQGVTDVIICTYASLLHKSENDFLEEFCNIDYMFFDEVHRIGAEKWGDAVRLLRKTFPNSKVIGMSATPIRTDGKNIIDLEFDGTQINPLYLADAILEDILPNPCYIASLYAIDDYFQEQLLSVENSRKIGIENKPLLVDEIKNSEIEYKKLYNIPNIIQKYVLLNAEYRKNMKFVIFIRDTSEIEDTKHIAKKWFMDAFSHMNKSINLYDVCYQKGRQENQRITDLFEENNKDDDIDVMISVNMFNEGIHLDEVTGVILLRKTSSDIIYFQQIGRAMNTTGKIPIIFDFVNNYKHLEDGYIQLFKNSTDNTTNNNLQTKTKSGDIINIHDEGKEFLDLLSLSIKKYEYLSILKENIEIIKEKLLQGYSCRKISIEMNIPEYPVRFFVKQYFPDMYSQKRQSLSNEDIQFIINNFKDMTVGEISEELDKTYAIIYNYCRNNNIDVKKGNQRIEETQEIIDYIRNNINKTTQKDIFTYLGITKDVFNRICKNNNIEKPKNFNFKRLSLSQKQIQYIKDNWIYKSMEEIAIDINEKYNSVVYYIHSHPEDFSSQIKEARIEDKHRKKEEEKQKLGLEKEKEQKLKEEREKKKENKELEEKINIFKSFNGELTIKELAEKTGFPSRTVQYICDRNQIPYVRKTRLIPKGLEFFTQAQRSAVADFLFSFNGNLSKEEMVKESGYGMDIIEFYISRYHVPYNVEKSKLEKEENESLNDTDKKFIDENVFILGIKECAKILDKKIEIVSPYWKESKYNQTPHRKKMTDEIKQYIRDNADKQTYYELAENVGMLYTSVQSFCRLNGIKAKKVKRGASEYSKQLVQTNLEKLKNDKDSIDYINENKDNITISKLVKVLPYGKVTINKYLEEQGIKLKTREKKDVPEQIINNLNKRNDKVISSKTKKEIIVKEYIELHPEKTQKEFVDDLNTSWAYVSRIINKYNLPYKEVLKDHKKGSRSKLSKDDKQHILEIYIPHDNEFGAEALARQYGVSVTTIRNVVKGKEYERKPQPWDELPFGKYTYEKMLEYKDVFIEEWNKGTSHDDIRKICGGISIKPFKAIRDYLLSLKEILPRTSSGERQDLDNNKILEEFQNGENVTKLADKYHTSTSTIKKRLLKKISIEEYQMIQKTYEKSRGYDLHKDDAICNEMIDLILKLKKEGLSNRQIEMKTGVRHQRVGDILKNIGYQDDTGLTVCKEIFNVIIQFKDIGKTYDDIAKLTGLHPKRVEYIIATNNNI